MSYVPATEYRHLLVATDGAAARITLNRAEKRNALSLELMEELIAALREASARGTTRAIVIEGAGPAFSAGHDLSEMIGRDEAFYSELFGVCTVLMETIHELPQPVIAKVHGIATAAGCQLVAACDLAIAADGTRFATPGVKIGLFCSTPMVPVSRAVGRKRALQLLLDRRADRRGDGARLGADQPRGAGRRARTRSRSSSSRRSRDRAAYTIATGKRAFYTQVDRAEHDAYEHCKVVMAENALAADAQEGISAFLQKRAPAWRGA